MASGETAVQYAAWRRACIDWEQRTVAREGDGTKHVDMPIEGRQPKEETGPSGGVEQGVTGWDDGVG
jgi:hypothetical protein